MKPAWPLTDIINLVGDSRLGYTATVDGDKVTIKPGAGVQTVHGVKVAGVAKYHGGQITARTLDRSAWEAAQIIAASIIYAESGGIPDNRNVNGPTSSAPGSVDRGFWQWNSQFWPDISDDAADDPQASTILAFLVSNGWQDWGPWTGSRGLDPNSEPSKAVRAAYGDMLGIVVDDTPILSWIDKNANGTPDAVDALGGWAALAGYVGAILKNLTSPAWWRRVGIVVVGVLMVLAALFIAT